MSTLFKLCFSNIGAKKFRSFLIILSVTLSTGLLYTILSLSSTITDYYKSDATKTIGNTDFIVSASKDATTPLMNELNSTTSSYQKIENTKYQIPLLEGIGYHDDSKSITQLRLHGTTIDDMNQVFILNDFQKSSTLFQDYNLIIGKRTSEILNLSIGDTYPLTIGGKSIDFSIWGIANDNNILSSSPTLINVIVPMETMETILSVKDMASVYLIGINDESKRSETLLEYQQSYPNLTIEEAVNEDDLSSLMSMITIPLSLMTLSVLLVSCFIIFSSFKIIIIERMPFIGTMRSLGSTKKTARIILLIESLFYSLIGGMVGILLGLGILKLTLNQIFELMDAQTMDFQLFYPFYAFISLTMAIVLVLISSIIPIIKLSTKSIKSLLYLEVENSKHFSLYRSFIGLVLIAIAFLLIYIDIKGIELLVSFIIMIFIFLGGAFIVPTVTIIASYPLKLIFKPIFGEHSNTALNQIKHDKTLMNNIILMSMGLAVILMINNLSASVSKIVTDVYGKCNADIIMMYYPFTDELIDKVENIDGVTHIYTTRGAFDIPANDGKIVFPLIDGIDGKGFSDYAWDEFGDKLTPDLIKMFQTKRSIITTSFLARKYDFDKGDILTLDFNGKKADYEIIEIVTSVMNNGNMSFIYEDFFVEDTDTQLYYSLYLDVDKDPQEVIQSIKEASPLTILPLESLSKMEEWNKKSNNSMFGLFKAVSIIAMAIGLIGIFNNYVISFMSRRKFIASLRSLGVNKASLFKLFIAESFICGLIGSISGITIGILLLEVMRYILENLNIASDLLTYQGKEFVFVLISGVTMAVISSIIPTISNIQRPIITELKFE